MNEAGLWAWFQDRPVSDAVLIAQRSALRVFPIVSENPAGRIRDLEFTALAFARLFLTSRVAVKRLPAEASDVAFAAAVNAALDALAPVRAAGAAGAALDAARAVRAVLDAVGDALFASRDALLGTARAAAYYDGEADMWEQIRQDARLLEADGDLLAVHLWSIPHPGWFRHINEQLRTYWRDSSPEHWSFWMHWWDGVLLGQQVDWALQEKVALIPDEIWAQGVEAVAAEIEHRRNGLALEGTNNAERIEINPATGKLLLVPDSELSEDIASYARRKMAKALDLFGDAPANQYTGLSQAFRVVTSALDDAANMPVELFDACASASRLTVGLARQGSCPSPEQDPLIQDFLTRIREAGADILAHDPKTQEVLERRNAILGNDALIEGREAIVAASAEIAVLSEGRLAVVLPEDAANATDPRTDPEERKAASVRLGGRLLRFGKIVVAGVGLTGGAIIGARGVLEAIPAIQASPIFQQAVEIVYRYLGF